MERNFDLKNRFEIKYKFEIRGDTELDLEPTGYVPGLVVILDGRIRNESYLFDKIAEVTTPNRETMRLKIAEARDHLKATSLFFKSLTTDDIPEGSTIKLNLPPED